MTKVIAIAHEKGGVGKTTTTINLGIGLARQGKNVLLLDADPQGDLTKCLGVKELKALRHTIASCMDYLIAHGEEDHLPDFVYTDAIRQHDEGGFHPRQRQPCGYGSDPGKQHEPGDRSAAVSGRCKAGI